MAETTETETVTEVRAVFTHLPTGNSWSTPWIEQEAQGQISGNDLTQDLETFFQSEDAVFVFNRGTYFALNRIVLQQCATVLEFRETVVT
jgi:hypothetical protein